MTLKIILVGDSGIGKTSLVLKFTGQSSLDSIPSTTAPLFFTKDIETECDRVSAEIWDTAGQEQYRSLMSLYYRGAGVALLCCSRGAMDSLTEWIEAVRSVSPRCRIVPVVTKADLYSRAEIEEVMTELERTGREMGLELGVVTSTVTGEGVEQAFIAAAQCGAATNVGVTRPTPRAQGQGCC
jgi:small GTP-binding protein